MNSETRLKVAIAVAIIFMLVEIIGGYIAHSLAIFADAAHLFSDIAGFVLALSALIVSRKSKSLVYTFGYGRAEILGALFSIGLLWMVTIYLVFEAFFRAIDWFEGKSPIINGKIMFGTAVFGIFVNLVLIVVFHEEHEQNVLHGCQHNGGGEAEGNVGEEVDTACHDEHNHHTDHHNHEHSHNHHIELSLMHSITPSKSAVMVAPSTLSSSAAVFTPMRTMTTSTTLQPITIGKATPANSSSNTTGQQQQQQQQQQRYMKMDDFDEEISPLPLNLSAVNNNNLTTPINSSSNSSSSHHNNSHDHNHHHDGDDNNSCCYGDHYQPHSSNNDSHSNCNHHNHDHHSQSSAVTNIQKTVITTITSNRAIKAAANSHDHDRSHSHSSHSHHHSHGGHDSNMKAAALHVMTDMIQSIGVAIAGAVVWYKPQWQIVDPICTLLFSILVLHSTLPLASSLVVTLMEAVPCHIDCARVESSLRAVKGVTEVGSLRIWSVSTHRSAATAHIQVTSATECARVLLETHRVCHDEYGISFVTLQVQAMPLSVAAAEDGDVINNSKSHHFNGSNSSMNQQQKRECPWVCDHV